MTQSLYQWRKGGHTKLRKPHSTSKRIHLLPYLRFKSWTERDRRSEGSSRIESTFCPSRAIDKPFLSHNLDPDWMDYFFESRLSCSWSLSANTIFELLYLAWLTTTLSRWTIVLSTPQWHPRYLDWITTLIVLYEFLPTWATFLSIMILVI